MYLFEATFENKKTNTERAKAIEVDSSMFPPEVQDHDMTAFAVASERAQHLGDCEERIIGLQLISD